MTIIEENEKVVKLTRQRVVGRFHTIVILTETDLKELDKLRGFSIDLLFVPRKLTREEWAMVEHSVTGEMFIL